MAGSGIKASTSSSFINEYSSPSYLNLSPTYLPVRTQSTSLHHIVLDFSKLLLEEQKDSKTLLQEFLQSLDEDLPEYVTTEKKQNGEIYFVSKVTLPIHDVFGEGQGKSKKLAEQEAASNVLIMLNKDGK